MRLIRTRLTWYAYLLSGFFTFIISIQGNIIPFLRDELQLSYAAVSLHPSALAAGMIAAGLLTERVLAAIGRRWTCLLGVAASAAMYGGHVQRGPLTGAFLFSLAAAVSAVWSRQRRRVRA